MKPRVSSSPPSEVTYRTLVPSDVATALRLWRESPGVGLSSADDPDELQSFISRNVGLCWVAESGGSLVGTILCGSDGRRGYIYHLAVADRHRRAGIGRALVGRAIDSARQAGIARCHAMVFSRNADGRRFWDEIGWRLRDDLVVYSRDMDDRESDALPRPG